jgi:hypothetical protein
MFAFKKAKLIDPRKHFADSLTALIKEARDNGVVSSEIIHELSGHIADIRMVAERARERRQSGTPQVISANLGDNYKPVYR